MNGGESPLRPSDFQGVRGAHQLLSPNGLVKERGGSFFPSLGERGKDFGLELVRKPRGGRRKTLSLRIRMFDFVKGKGSIHASTLQSSSFVGWAVGSSVALIAWQQIGLSHPRGSPGALLHGGCYPFTRQEKRSLVRCVYQGKQVRPCGGRKE